MEDNKQQEELLEENKEAEAEEVEQQQETKEVDEKEKGIFAKFKEWLKEEDSEIDKVEETKEEKLDQEQEAKEVFTKEDVQRMIADELARKEQEQQFGTLKEQALAKVDPEYHDFISSKLESDKEFDIDKFLEEKPVFKKNDTEVKKEVTTATPSSAYAFTTGNSGQGYDPYAQRVKQYGGEF